MQLDTISCEGEWTMYFHLGKVFISHTVADKPFVRRLAARLEKSHFQVWLDEHDLIAGDRLFLSHPRGHSPRVEDGVRTLASI